jgi:hypothetical protein
LTPRNTLLSNRLMQNNPFHVPPEAMRAHDYCFYRLCWFSTPEDIKRQWPFLARQADLAAISAYLDANSPSAEYLSPFFPQSRAEALCGFKMYQGWSNERIARTFPVTARLVDLADLRRSRTNLEQETLGLLQACRPSQHTQITTEPDLAAARLYLERQQHPGRAA